MTASRTSADPPAVLPVEPGTLSLYLTLIVVASLSGLLVVAAYELTEGRVEENRRQARERAILQVLPGARQSIAFVRRESGDFRRGEAAEDGELVHAGFDASGNLVGLALEARGTGYQDAIRLLYGYSPRERAVVGLVVLESRETPGLGDAIESPEFARNFERLDVSLSSDGSRLAHAVEAVPAGTKTEPWQVDAISGATVSSRAVARIVGESTARWVPRLASRLEEFQP